MKRKKDRLVLIQMQEFFDFYKRSLSNKLFLLSSLFFVVSSTATFLMIFSKTKIYFLFSASTGAVFLLVMIFSFAKLEYIEEETPKRKKTKNRKKNKVVSQSHKKKSLKKELKESVCDKNKESNDNLGNYLYGEPRPQKQNSKQDWSSSEGELSGRLKKWLDDR